ncbi:uncharacterized protein Dvar_10310 [Desulfosarcina variabilis str. Montpellier]
MSHFFLKLYHILFPNYGHAFGFEKVACIKTTIGYNKINFILYNWLYLLPIVFILPCIIYRKEIGFGDLKIKKEKAIVWITISLLALDGGYILKAYLFDKTTFPPVIQMIRVFYDCFMGSIYEEITYREIIQNYFCRIGKKIPIIKKYPNLIGIFISSIIFSLGHHNSNLGFFIQRTVLGMLFGFLFYKSGTIWLPTIIHTMHNLIIRSLFVL